MIRPFVVSERRVVSVKNDENLMVCGRTHEGTGRLTREVGTGIPPPQCSCTAQWNAWHSAGSTRSTGKTAKRRICHTAAQLPREDSSLYRKYISSLKSRVYCIEDCLAFGMPTISMNLDKDRAVCKQIFHYSVLTKFSIVSFQGARR